MPKPGAINPSTPVPAPLGSLDLAAAVAGGHATLIRGGSPGDQAGFSIAAAGDLRGDGHADLVVGAPFADVAGRLDSGKAFFIHAVEPGQAPVDLAKLQAWG